MGIRLMDWRWAFVFIVIGMNSIVIYFLEAPVDFEQSFDRY